MTLAGSEPRPHRSRHRSPRKFDPMKRLRGAVCPGDESLSHRRKPKLKPEGIQNLQTKRTSDFINYGTNRKQIRTRCAKGCIISEPIEKCVSKMLLTFSERPRNLCHNLKVCFGAILEIADRN